MVADLVRRARSGEAEAYTELVRRFQDAVFATAYQQVLDPDAARDIAQENFVRAYEALLSLRDPQSFPAWIVRISRNLAVSWLRRPERAWEPLEAAPAASEDVAPSVEARDLVGRALSALPNDNRLALSLVLVDGYSYQEVAEMTGTSLSTVRGRVHRARRQLATEVLGMVGETLQGHAPGEEFTVEAVRESLFRARDARWKEQDAGAAAAIAEEALSRLDHAQGDPAELRDLRIGGLRILRSAVLHVDLPRAAQVTREVLRLAEEAGDAGLVQQCLRDLVDYDKSLSEEERRALRRRATEQARDTGQTEATAIDLWCEAWEEFYGGGWERGLALLGEAREALAGQPYGGWHGCLEAADDLLAMAGGPIDPARVVWWGAGCTVLALEDGRLVLLAGLGTSGRPGDGEEEEQARFADPYYLLSFGCRWFPHTAPEPGFEDERPNHSYTRHPTRAHIRLLRAEEPVSTPAGVFDDCLLLRSTVTESPLDAGDESRQRDLNRGHVLGEFACWFAQGVGPVAYRHERANGITTHTVLSRFACPEKRPEWFPLVVGARWEYAPAEPPEHFSARMLSRVVRVSEAGHCYIADSALGLRHS
jgi:RNA polymerase sigma-70 factor, ECF subfamily